MAAFFCKECKQAILTASSHCKFVYYKSLHPTEIWNDFQLQILEMGGNEALKTYMSAHNIIKADFNDELI